MNDLLIRITILLVAIVGLRNSLWIGQVKRQLRDRLDENEKRIDQLGAAFLRLKNDHCILCGGDEAPHGGTCDTCRWRSGTEWESL